MVYINKNEFREFHSKNVGLFLEFSEILYRKKTDYQEITVIENKDFGRVLIIDGLVMLTEKDEFIYHEMLVHPALSLIHTPEKILLIGGGDGGCLREIIKHPVKEIDWIEIDRDVIEVSKKFFPWSDVFEDKRIKLYLQDASLWIKKIDKHYDAIVIDSSDPVGPAEKLYRLPFYRNLARVLKPEGIILLQSGSWLFHLSTIKKNFRALSSLFKETHLFTSPTPTYPGGSWCYIFVSQGVLPSQLLIRIPDNLRYYNPEIHCSAFSLPNFLKQYFE